MSKILITGITGSGASYLAEYLLNHVEDIEIHGISRWHSTSTLRNIKNIKDRLILHECDLTDFSAVLSTLKKSKPDYIFHLAAHANVKVCFSNPLAVVTNNVNNTLVLFEAIRHADIDPIIQLCGTSEVYGLVNSDVGPISESYRLDPVNVYAVSKLTQEKIAKSYFHCYKFKTILTRMFTYINPRRNDIFSTAFANQIVNIENGKQDVLYHGNLDSVRTLIDVRDAMRSYWVASNHCQFGEEYNIGGTDTLSVGELLERLKSKAKVKIKSELDPQLLRPKDVTLQIPDARKFIRQTGWEPHYSLDESLDFLLDHCRKNYVG